MQDNNLNWKGYEEITRYIYHTLGSGYGIKILGHGPGCKLKGKSNSVHQIDVLTEHTNGKSSYRTAIECKYWQKKVNKDTVMKLAAIIEDLDIEKGIIVSKEGFTLDALNFAQYKNIELIQLKEAGKDYNNGNHKLDLFTLDIGINAIMTRPKVTCIDFGEYQITDEREILSMHYAKIRLENGQNDPFGNYMSTFQRKLHNKKLLEIYSQSYPVKGTLIEYRKGDILFENITFTGFLLEEDHSTTRSFNIVDQVWMIMRSIFEDKVFVLSQGGIIIQDAPGKNSD
ncbi:restriction endonuclease [Pedobacter sp. ASV12]|uniref:restriction endonuclease n=1 Tax=Pedobacter sp. ASV12 TaxID=2795120 RepID=UPI0018ECD7AE|nr:restriction endonuclease [Pedobacter sp. ASV12]